MITIGLMSGTSLDGVDAVAVDFEDDRMRLLGRAHASFASELRSELLALALGCEREIERMGDTSRGLAEAYARAVEQLLATTHLAREDVAALGAHGQTIRHRPERGFTVQLNYPALLAELTGIDVVADFRSRDVAAGGEGAPLVPAFHAERFRTTRPRAVLNIGGIANATLLPALGDATPVSGFDTGPGNMLLDAWMSDAFGRLFDEDGRTAAEGRISERLLEAFLDEPYFRLPPPKSTGRECFDFTWLEARLHGVDPRRTLDPRDVAATLTELTAISAARAILSAQPDTAEVLMCGGGALNPTLRARLAAHLPGVRVTDTGEYGLAPMEVEGAAFAWLARMFLLRLPGNLPAVTRARGPRILGCWYPA